MTAATATNTAAHAEARRVAALRRVETDGWRLLEQTLGRTYPISDRLAAWAGELATKARLRRAESRDLDQIVAELAFPAAVKLGVASTRLLDEQPNLLSHGVCAATARAYGRGQITVTSALLGTLERLASDVIRAALREDKGDADRRLETSRLIERARDAIDAAEGTQAAGVGAAADMADALLDAARALTDAAALLVRS